MAAISVKRNSFVLRLKPLLPSQNLYHKHVEDGNKPQSRSDKDSSFEPGEINVSKWKTMDSRSLGITKTMVPLAPYNLLKTLRTGGFEAYLVGGCVRDLLLNRTPKDFDVITTADLHQIKKQFRRCVIVGRRFPICVVHIKGSVIEVSSFKTLAKHDENKEKFIVSQMPRGCKKSDLNLWKNSMHRDFTVNSLFFDPHIHKIYDYTNGMKDLLELKLRTLVPAHLSFTEDCARILRGLRIAARLGLSFVKDTEIAIHKHASSILDLSKSRIILELNYMLSFGAAESSLRLLHRFHILEILLPFQAAYVSRQSTRSGPQTMMLMELLSHMDKFLTCDQPSACRLWIGLLAFHQALVIKPQDPFVVLTFASVLYHQKWQEGLQFARECRRAPISFEPEISEPCDFISDEELSKKVHQLALQVLDSIDVLVDRDSLQKTMSKFFGFPCSGLVFISKTSAHGAAQLFHVLAHEVETYNKGRTSFEMNYHLLGKGDTSETRFALGKIILNTMGCGVDQDNDNHPATSRAENGHVTPFDSRLQQSNAHNPKKQKLIAKSSSSKKQNAATEKKIEDIEDGFLLDQEQRKEVSLGKIILNTMDCGVDQDNDNHPATSHAENEHVTPSDSRLQQSNAHNPKKQKLIAKSSGSKKQNAVTEKKIEDIEDGFLLEQEQRKEVVSMQHIKILGASYCPEIEDRAMEKPEEITATQSPMQKEAVTENEKFPSQLEAQNSEEKLNVDAEVQVDQLMTKEQSINRKHKRKQVVPLSSLFK